MRKDTIVIREIEQKDNPKIAKAIRSVLIEMGVPKVGTAYEDVSLDYMTETYSKPKTKYFVLSKGENILGGAGVAPPPMLSTPPAPPAEPPCLSGALFRADERE